MDAEVVLEMAADWLKKYGETTGITKDNVMDSLNDGILFTRAIEKATKVPPPSKVHQKTILPVHRIDNLNVAVAQLTKAGVNPNPTVTAQEIFDKEKKKVVVLFQSLLLKYP